MAFLGVVKKRVGVCDVATVVASTCRAETQPLPKPNVLFIAVDDLGWADTALYGKTSLYETPNLERLAARGMTFTNAYAASPICLPTRASIMSGQNPARHGMTSPAGRVPLLGEYNSQATMDREIAAAAGHGVDFFAILQERRASEGPW